MFVMNTIPTTFKQLRVPYAVVGGEKIDRKTRPPAEISLLLLSRSSRVYLSEIIAQLDKSGMEEVLVIESSADQYEMEGLSAKYPRIRFILLQGECSPGEQINIGVHESHGKAVLVLWDDMRLYPPLVPLRLMDRFAESGLLCVVPLLQNQKRETLPTIQAPAYFRRQLKMIRLQPASDGMKSLYPFDYVGVYHKERFIKTGGFDPTISRPHWQKMDFGFRTHMWGEKIECSTGFRLQYLQDPMTENETPDAGYRRFFLKTLGVRFHRDSGRLPGSRFLPFFFRSGLPLFQALREYREVRDWVEVNRYRFNMDARSVTELWELEANQ